MTDDPMRHNYMRKLMALWESGAVEKGNVTDIQVRHDSWCAIYKGGYCNCDPDVAPFKKPTN